MTTIAANSTAAASPRWGKGHIPADPRTRYRAALDSYRRAEMATYGTEISAAEFASDCCAEMDVREVVWGEGDAEVVAEVAPTPEEWADAAEVVARRFYDSYTVRNTLRPEGDWEWEQMQRANGLGW